VCEKARAIIGCATDMPLEVETPDISAEQYAKSVSPLSLNVETAD